MDRAVETLITKKLFKVLLKRGTLGFSFKKKDGSNRVAKGTLKIACIPSDKRPKGTGKPEKDHIVRYFDLDKKEWRSMIFDNLISVWYAKDEPNRKDAIYKRLVDIDIRREEIKKYKKEYVKKLNSTDKGVVRSAETAINSIKLERKAMRKEVKALRKELSELL